MGFVEAISDHIEETIEYVVEHLIPAFVVLFLFFVAGWLVPKIVAACLKKFYIFPDRYIAAIKIVLRVTIDVLGVVEWIVLLGIDMTTALVSFGVLSLSVSIALSGPLSNIFSGVTIQLFGTAQKGDVVTTAGIRGTISHFGVIHVHVLTTQKNVVYENKVPNSVFNQSVVILEPPIDGDIARVTQMRPTPPPYADQAYVAPAPQDRLLSRWSGNQALNLK